MKKLVIMLLAVFAIFSCGKKERAQKDISKQTVTENQGVQDTGWDEIMASVVKLQSFDGNRILETGQGFFVAENVIVTKLSLLSGATHIVFNPLNENKTYTIDKYLALDRINDIILLHCEALKRKPIDLFIGIARNSEKTMYLSASSGKAIQLFSGKVLNLATVKGNKLYRVTNRVQKSMFGMPVFTSSKKSIGVAFSAIDNYDMQSFVIPSDYIIQLLEKQKKIPETLASLRSGTDDKTAAENRSIKGLLLETDAGNITIRLFNETAAYRDNFIKLAKEGYFDSLLIHRVIKDFGIQSGAADTRYAEKGDKVGYKGPGYTIPAHFVPGFFHRRGMIGSPRKPDTSNEKLRSDGSQFYIVSGRRYNDSELDEIEKTNNHKFTAAQREVYKSEGGAPHLDGSYTIFGEVVDGMEVVDQIVKVETDNDWRPLKDIRLRKVRILR